MSSVKWIQGVVISLSLLLGACGGGGGNDSDNGDSGSSDPVAAITSPADGSIFPEGSDISFTGTGSDDEDGTLSGTSLEWSSDIDDELGTGVAVSSSSLSAGSHTITLKATDSDGAMDTDTITISVNAAPVIGAMEASPASVNVGAPITFSWTISDAESDMLTCGLDINGDGTDEHTIDDCANGSQAHIYAQAGDYQIRLTVTDNINAPVQQSVNVTVTDAGTGNASPQIDSFNVTPDAPKTGDAVTFSWNVSDADGDTLTCGLDINGDGTDEHTINDCANGSQAHIYAQAGDYQVRLTVTDNINAPVQQSVNVTVTDAGNASPQIDSFNVTPDVPKTGEAVTFSWNVSDADGDTLTCGLDINGDGTDEHTINNCANGSQAHIYAQAGDYQVRLTVTDNINAPVQQSLNITITDPDTSNASPEVASFNATPDVPTTSNSMTFDWTVSDADDDTLTCKLDVDEDGTDDYTISDCADNTSQAHTYTQAGAYKVRLTVEDGTNSPVLTEIDLTVSSAPPVISEFTVNPDPAYSTVATTFYWQVSDPEGDTLTCLLDINNDGTDDYTIEDCANIASQAHVYASSDDYTARLTVRDSINETQTTVSLVVKPHLLLDVTVDGPVSAGKRALYTMTVGNVSAAPVDDVTVSLVVPSELSFVWSTDAEPNVSSGCSTCAPATEPVWNLGTLAPGESRTIAVNALVNAATLNDAAITLPVTFSATDISDIQIDKVVEVFNAPSADLALGASTDPVVANETFTYQLDFGNTSAGSLTTVELRAFLPPGVTVNSISDGGTEVDTGEVVWDVGSLGVGASLHREITVTTDSGLVAGQILKTTARLTHDGGQAVDNVAEHALTVVAAALPLEVDISTSASPVVADERVLYTLTISNSSQLPVNDVNVQLRVPAELSFVWSTDAEPNVSTGCSVCGPVTESGWNLGTLAAGESRTITVNAQVDSVLSGNLISVPVRVTATGLGDTIDLRNTVAVFNSPLADLALSASTDPVVANETFTYQLDFGNTSAGSLTTVELRAFLPPGVTVSSISDGGTEIDTGEIVWNVATLNTGVAVRREITVVADDATAGDILMLSAELSYDGGLEIDNRSEFAVSVAKGAGIASLLSVDVTATPQPVASSGVLAYTITVTNGYALPVDGVSVQLRMPAELSFVWSTDAEPNVSAGCSVCGPTTEPTWNLGTMAAGASQVITINATVAASQIDGTLIVIPVRVTTTDMEDTINLQHVTIIEN